MSGLIPREFIEDLVARSDIVEVIGARVPLKKSGREFAACCPFHGEKTASFYVSPQKQFYHCFGCGVHGNALGFLIEYEHMEFVDAVFSPWNGQHAANSRPDFFSGTRAPITSTMSVRATRSSMKSRGIRPDMRLILA